MLRRMLGILTRAVGVSMVAASVAQAQPSQPLSGVVRDPTGTAVSGATITVTGASLASPRSVVCDVQGTYPITVVRSGSVAMS
jgi:hypothetical protein